jgi:hypothetical protein
VVARDEVREGLSVREIQPAATGDEEFPADGRLGLIHGHGRAGACGNLGRAQARGSAPMIAMCIYQQWRGEP